jgi:hypothetical protein
MIPSKKIKLLALFTYIGYVILCYVTVNPNLDYLMKSHINNEQFCAILIGGSAMQMGFSASLLEENTRCKSVNLALNSSGREFQRYSDWLAKRNLRSNYLFYAPIELWDLQLRNPDKMHESFLALLPKFSMARALKASLFGESTIDNRGDVSFYNCSIYQTRQEIDESKFKENNQAISELILSRVEILKQIFKDSKIFLIAPPIKTTTNNQSIYKDLIEQRISLMELQGLRFIRQVDFFVGKEYFCNDSHSNSLGKMYFTKELSNFLILNKRNSLRQE